MENDFPGYGLNEKRQVVGVSAPTVNYEFLMKVLTSTDFNTPEI
jgi:hypothetical protein